MNSVDSYVADLASRLSVGRRERTRILAEVRDHLGEAIAGRERAGEHGERAVELALEAFGPASFLASELNAAVGTRAMHRAPVIAIVAGALVFGGLIVAAATQPRARVSTNATIATQVSFFAAAIAFQVAFVAGACAASRALALSRGQIVRGDDRQFVVRCATISVYALSVAALGWTATAGLALNRLIGPDMVTLVGGSSVMICTAGVAVIAIHRMRVNPDDESSDAHSVEARLLCVGERSIALVRGHPVVSCCAIASFTALLAMSHAAIPYGLLQAAAVVLGFVLLGPTLGLRRARSS
jgi:hypothetical protein